MMYAPEGPLTFRGLVPYAAAGYAALIRRTTRLRTVRGSIRDRLRNSDRRFIYAFWHQRQAFFTVSHNNDKMSMLISRSRDGEIIAETIRLCGVPSVRGSSSRGASGAVRALMSAVQSGRDIGITPDGPKGPERQVKAGILFLAQTLGIPILPITNAQSNRFVLSKAWDHFHVPMPFGRSVVVYGEPVEVRPGDDLAGKALELKNALDEITREADLLVAAPGLVY
ncbi:MAG: lysophospholipid acyltransferase family protein [Elusimicrobia bacterium]|nr:lysophospholipid acyltransferase family protein [Elusimicrobiota bacterium]